MYFTSFIGVFRVSLISDVTNLKLNKKYGELKNNFLLENGPRIGQKASLRFSEFLDNEVTTSLLKGYYYVDIF